MYKCKSVHVCVCAHVCRYGRAEKHPETYMRINIWKWSWKIRALGLTRYRFQKPRLPEKNELNLIVVQTNMHSAGKKNTFIYTYENIPVRMCIQICTYCLRVDICSIYIYTHIFVCIFIYIYRYMYVYVYPYVCMYTGLKLPSHMAVSNWSH